MGGRKVKKAEQKKQYKRYNKPPYTYAAMIIVAIEHSIMSRLTLAQIINSISHMFPFFRDPGYEGWKASIRHNLTQYPYFKMYSDPDNPRNKGRQCMVDYKHVSPAVFQRTNSSQSYKATLQEELCHRSWMRNSQVEELAPETTTSQNSPSLPRSRCRLIEPTALWYPVLGGSCESQDGEYPDRCDSLTPEDNHLVLSPVQAQVPQRAQTNSSMLVRHMVNHTAVNPPISGKSCIDDHLDATLQGPSVSGQVVSVTVATQPLYVTSLSSNPQAPALETPTNTTSSFKSRMSISESRTRCLLIECNVPVPHSGSFAESSGLGHLPSSLGHLPSSLGHMPSNIGLVPSNFGHLSSSLSHVASSLGHVPYSLRMPVPCQGHSASAVPAGPSSLVLLPLSESQPNSHAQQVPTSSVILANPGHHHMCPCLSSPAGMTLQPQSSIARSNLEFLADVAALYN